MRVTPDPFVPGERLNRTGVKEGLLSGLRFAAKDNFDVAGRKTGLGLAHGGKIALDDATLIAACLAGGADLIGKTIMDELAFSLLGLNAAFGAPLNPAAPGCIAGGSSCGSASIVAQALADFALATDTAGSIRVPASFCGVWGLRPTHGALSTRGMAPLAQSFDVPGWFCANAGVFRRVSEALLPRAPPREIKCAIICDWLFEGAPDRRAAAISWAQRGGLAVSRQTAPPAAIEAMLDMFRTVQLYEAHAALGEFADNPDIPEDIAARLRDGAGVTRETYQAALLARSVLSSQLDTQLDGAVMLAPAAPLPFKLSALETPQAREQARRRILTYTVLASLGALPQIVMPMWRDADGPVGLGLIASRGGDRDLLELCIPRE